MQKKRVILTFPANLIAQPVTYRLTVDYDLVPNILRANITPNEEGVLMVELSGKRENLNRGLDYLRSIGVGIKPLGGDVSYDEEKCTHCTACITVCPTGALELDREKMMVSFLREKCIACGLCIGPCPYHALTMEV